MATGPEAGARAMSAGICEGPWTIRAVLAWHDMLRAGNVRLRDIIDLDAPYGAGPDGKKNAGMANHATNANGANGANGAVAVNGADGAAPTNGAAASGANVAATNGAGNGAAPAANDDEAKSENGEAAIASDDDDEDDPTLPLSAMQDSLKLVLNASLEKIFIVDKRF